MSDIWSRIFRDPNGTKIISDFERNGSRLKQFREPKRSDVNESLYNGLSKG